MLSTEARVALTLRLLGGLTTDEIARAFLVSEPTIAQRIVRAKRTLPKARVPFEVPRGAELAGAALVGARGRLSHLQRRLLGDRGDDWMRPALCEDALRLGRILAELAPDEPEVHGLVALMEIQASRSRARVGPTGEPDSASRSGPRAMGPTAHPARPCRARARGIARRRARPVRTAGRHRRLPRACGTAEDTDWTRIAVLYAELARAAPSPVVELNRAVAAAMAFGPALGLQMVDALAADSSLAGYHLLPAVRGDLLEKLGRRAEARQEFERAASLTRNAREREVLLDRASAAGAGPAPQDSGPKPVGGKMS